MQLHLSKYRKLSGEGTHSLGQAAAQASTALELLNLLSNMYMYNPHINTIIQYVMYILTLPFLSK